MEYGADAAAAAADFSHLRDKKRFYLPGAEFRIVSDCITQLKRCGELYALYCLSDVIGWHPAKQDL